MTYLSILVNDGTGAFAAPVAYEAAPGGFPTARTRVALRDLDNDGDADLIGGGVYEDGSVTAGAITIRRNDGQGSFGAHEAYLDGELRLRSMVAGNRRPQRRRLRGHPRQHAVALGVERGGGICPLLRLVIGRCAERARSVRWQDHVAFGRASRRRAGEDVRVSRRR